MSYLFVLIHLVNIYFDNYSGISNEVRIVCVCVYIYIYIYIYDMMIPLIMMTSSPILRNDELYLLS